MSVLFPRRAGHLCSFPWDYPKTSFPLHRSPGCVLFWGAGYRSPRYGMEWTPEVQDIDRDRDLFRNPVRRPVSAGLPFLGICRWPSGGSTWPLADALHPCCRSAPQAFKRNYYPDWPRDTSPSSKFQTVRVQLAAILEIDEIQTNSLHHQGVWNFGSQVESHSLES